MSFLLFDISSGISGDMVVGAALDMGLDHNQFKNSLKSLDIDFNIEISDINKNGIKCTKFNVITKHEHTHRHLKHIEAIINNSDLSQNIKNMSLGIFKNLAKAEANVHGTTPDKVHFHEVGAVDAIVDIVGACTAFEMLEIKDFFVTPFTLGRGISKCEHGNMSVPVPAVVELLNGFPVINTSINHELVTPTGAAIATTLALPVSNLQEYVPVKTGYGAGMRDIEDIPNVLRIILGKKKALNEHSFITEIETNVDDVSGEVISSVMDMLFKNNALDVFFVPVYSKKNRPSYCIHVLCYVNDQEKIAKILLSGTGSAGLRFSQKKRICLDRKIKNVQTKYGIVKVKEVDYFGNKRQVPEYDSCMSIANEKKMNFIDIYNETLRSI